VEKKYVGIIIHEGKAYILALPHAHTSERDNQIRYLQMPNFLDEVSSYENTLSHLFEFKVGEFLRQRYNYSKVLIRYKPVYLDGKEIDIYAEKGQIERSLTICECKLRLNNSPISLHEVESFGEKIPIIKEKEAIVHRTRFNFWFITNADFLDADVKVYTKREEIEIKSASTC
jgi:hypothetical protein